MTDSDNALAIAFERAAGICECIGGACPALTHRPGVNRCFGILADREAAFFFTIARFADRNDAESIVTLCGACAQSPRKNAVRVMPRAPSGGDAGDVTR